MTSPPRAPNVGSLLVVSGAALFGTVGTARVLGPEAPSISVSSVRLALAALVLLVLAMPHGSFELRRAATTPAIWVAGLSQAAFNVTFFGAVTRSGVALGTLVAIGCTPLLTGLLARHVTRTWLLVTTLALAGLAALLGGDLGRGSTSVSGLLFALGASASYATFIKASSTLASSPVAMPARLAAIFSVAALSLAPALAMTDSAWALTVEGTGMVLYLSLAATVLAYNLFNRGLGLVDPGTAATFALTEPLVAAVLGVVVLEEHLSPLSWLGATVVLVALLLMIRVSASDRSRTQSARDRTCRELP